MAFKNFTVETDADGIALVTWNIPGRSMNVLDQTSTDELEEIVKQTSADAAVKGSKPLPGQQPPAQAGGGMLDGLKDVLFGSTGPRGGKREGLAEAAAKSAMRSVGSAVGREIIRINRLNQLVFRARFVIAMQLVVREAKFAMRVSGPRVENCNRL